MRKKEREVIEEQLWMDRRLNWLRDEEKRLEALKKRLLRMDPEDPRLKVMTDAYIEGSERAVKERDALSKNVPGLHKKMDIIMEELMNLDEAWVHHTQHLRDKLQIRECGNGREGRREE